MLFLARFQHLYALRFTNQGKATTVFHTNTFSIFLNVCLARLNSKKFTMILRNIRQTSAKYNGQIVVWRACWVFAVYKPVVQGPIGVCAAISWKSQFTFCSRQSSRMNNSMCYDCLRVFVSVSTWVLTASIPWTITSITSAVWDILLSRFLLVSSISRARSIIAKRL